MADDQTSPLIVGGELMLYGDVGGSFVSDGFTSSDVRRALAGMKGDITVRLNSGGGLVFEGTAIHTALKAHKGQVRMVVDGVAASAASLIAMAGDTIEMADGAMMMIHDPAGLTMGTADAHVRTAKVLRGIANSAAAIYASRSGHKQSDILAIMADETWFTADEAVAAGFADAISSDAAQPVMAFDYGLYRDAPASLPRLDGEAGQAARREMAAATQRFVAQSVTSAQSAVMGAASSSITREEPAMADIQHDAGAGPTAVEPTPKTTLSSDPTKAAVMAERQRVKEITALCTKHKMAADFTQGFIDDGADLTAVRLAILDKRAEADEASVINHHIVMGDDATDRFRMGAEKALALRAGLDGGERNEFSGLSLTELARESLGRSNMSTRGGKYDVVGRAFLPRMAGPGYHTTSDFSRILANTANKSLLKAYNEAPETWRGFVSVGTLPDYKPASRVALNAFGDLDEIEEHGEYTYGTFGERYATIQVSKFGKMFAISREAVINDDLSEFTRAPAAIGRAARRKVGDKVYAVLTGNPTFVDGTALFHATHKNLAAAGAAPSVASLDAARSAMALQTDPSGNATALNITPAIAVVPVSLYGAFKKVIEAEFDPDGETLRDPNIVRGMVRDVIADSRLDKVSKTGWYLMADPSMHDTIEVAFLDGRQEPQMEERDGWSVDGVEMKVRHEFGVAPLDYVAMYKNAGE